MPDPITSSITILVAGDNALSAENAGNSGATLVSASGQLVAAIGSITPAGSIATAPGAAAVTLMKITLDLQSGAGASYGDIASVIGNLLSLTGGVIAFVPGLQAPGIGLTILGNVANGVGLYSDRQQIIGAFQNLWNSMQSGQSVSTGAPALQEIQGTLTSQSWFESGERSALGNATGQIASDGTILVPQTDSSGNIVNYVPEQPIAPPQDLGGGLTRYSFAGGTTVDVQSPTDPSANSGVIANWTIPQLNGIATQLSIDTQMGGSVLSVTDASGNVVEKFNDVVTQVNGIVSHTYSTMTSGGQTNEQTQVTSNGDSTNTQSTVFNGDGTVSYTENILYSNGIISRDEIDANINSSLSVFGDGVVLNGLGGNDVSILGNANVLNLSNSSIRFSSGVTGEVAGTGNQVSLGKANDISISGSSNAISSTGDASGSTITLNGTGNSADTLNLFGATGITVLLGDSTTAVNLVATSATVTSRSGGGVVNGSGGDRLNISGADITVNGNGGQYVFSGTGDLANISNATVAFSADSQATLVGTRNSFSLGLDSSLTLEVTGATSPTTVITTDSQGNATFTSSGGSVLFGPVGQEITQASNGALSVAVGATGMVQVFLPTGESAGSPIQFSGIESMTLNTDGGYSMVDQSGNAYTLQPVSGSSNYVLENATTGTMNVTLDTGSVTGISLGQALSIQTSSGGTLALPAAGGAGSLALSNLGNVSLDAGSAIAISANAIDVSVPGSGTTSEYAFASDGTVSSISTYDDSSAQHVPAVVTSFNSDGVATQQLTNNASGGSQVVLLNAADPSAGFISQTQYFAGANGTGSLISQATNFTNGLSEIDEYNPAPGTVLTRTQYSGVDGSGEVLSQTTNFLDGTSTVTTYATSSSASSGLSSSGITSQTVTYSGWDGSGDAINTTYNSTTNSTISGANIGSALGSKIGQLLGGNSAIESIGLSSVLGCWAQSNNEPLRAK
ncbi:beta strand repeat-containing protein [Burkholderia pyrrocinia]|uniref:beta strand repeat-containing protein n=1 Tax=Burkholderia pyrrocinia TaxID=60550 RepID=UPI000AD5060F|nr:hypothetical protein [Burkholderia pyrrocinia]